ncbi:PTS transporter subunit IIC [Scatolibacter rhodanostii]|uniref:PTS transporter subunit IIC n=1 Tax=Scatolibacter rhodanostii TaxID=2014781 RepID=UPI001FA89E09|nr:PTS sugar transporter subunit IIC [Scatolibacter rhodanostii]
MNTQTSKKSFKELARYFGKRWLIEAMNAMGFGLLASLVIGLILSQISKVSFLGFLAPYAAIVAASSPVVGAAVGAAIAYKLDAKLLVIIGAASCGAFGYSLGGPVGAYIAALVGTEIGSLVAGKTPVDIIITPIITLVSGSIAGQLVGPGIQSLMVALGSIINTATTFAPLPMGIIIGSLVGMVLTGPISSAGLCIMLDLSGLAAGAAAAGCAAQMVGFAVASFRDNGIGGLLSQGFGTSKIQFVNVIKHPAVWIAPTVSSAICGALSASVFKLENIASGAGMGSSGLVGQFGTFAAMPDVPQNILLLQVIVLHFLIPALIAFLLDYFLRKKGIVKLGDMKLQV